MRRLAFALLASLVSTVAYAQQPNTPGSVTPAATVNEPLTVNATVQNGGAITVNNFDDDTQSMGIKATSSVIGGEFNGFTGLRAFGQYRGGYFSCLIAGCVAGDGEAYGRDGVGIRGYGQTGILGTANTNFGTAWAGRFNGNVSVEGRLSVSGTVDSPQMQDMQNVIAQLLARVSALEAASPGTPSGLIIRIEAEDYTAYHDLTQGNAGGAYRNGDVDIKASQEGGYAVGWFTSGEWLSYDFNVPVAGSYRLDFRVGAAVPGRTFAVELNGFVIANRVTVTHTGEWDKYATVNATTLTLPSGRHTIRVIVNDLDYMDFNWFEVVQR